MGVFIICWLPFFVTNIVAGICPGCISNPELTFAVIFITIIIILMMMMMINPKVLTWLGWINSSMNPVIYACCSTEFRRSPNKPLDEHRHQQHRHHRRHQQHRRHHHHQGFRKAALPVLPGPLLVEALDQVETSLGGGEEGEAGHSFLDPFWRRS